MSPDRVTMTRAEAIRRRREEEQKRRDSMTQKRISIPKPAPPKVDRNAQKAAPVKAAGTGRHDRRYDIAMSTPYGRAGVSAKNSQASGLTMPKFGLGARWISFLLIGACAA